jgi:predicted nucleotidyltransferase
MSIEAIKKKSIPILEKHGVKKAALFGSHARGEAGKKSDVDFLVDIPDTTMSILGIIGLKLELEAALHADVDLVEYDAIKPSLRRHILHDQVVLYG